MEGVIRSNGSLTMASMSDGMNSKSMGFWWHKEPADGFYCIYRKRATENVSSCGLPDCPNIPQALRRHADMLTAASVDFIVADSTNAQSVGSVADALQLRPWEVVGEEWLALRKQGIKTPKIAIWQNLGLATVRSLSILPPIPPRIDSASLTAKCRTRAGRSLGAVCQRCIL